MVARALLQIRVISVNLASTTSTENHQPVLRLSLLNQRIRAGVHNPLGSYAINEVVVFVLFDFVYHRNSNMLSLYTADIHVHELSQN